MDDKCARTEEKPHPSIDHGDNHEWTHKFVPAGEHSSKKRSRKDEKHYSEYPDHR
jgi:hypothetical protein